ncbi:MAG: DNA/RNA nuclease SfsA [Pseudoruegeria sp.]
MRFQTPLIPATLIRRYKRFLADVRLPDEQEVVAHCPNPGGMLGLKDEGLKIWVEPNDDPKKKLKYGWRLVEHGDGHWTGIDTAIPNRVVKEALVAGQVAAMAAYKSVRPEVAYGKKSRVDFLLTQDGLPDCYLEVKNVHFKRNGDLAEFPDSVTARGKKHLEELSEMVAEGHRAVMFYLIQRTDCTRFALADDLDPAYAEAFEKARAKGVEVLCYDCEISTKEITLGKVIPLSE